MARLTEGTIVLLVVLLFGIIGGNELVAVAAAVMLLLQVGGFSDIFRFLEDHGIELGVIFLLLGLLLPFATGKMGVTQTAGSLLTPVGLISIGVGTLAAYLAAEGVHLLRMQPEVMLGLVIGSVLGVYFLNGIPAGPLVAAGIAAVLYHLIR